MSCSSSKNIHESPYTQTWCFKGKGTLLVTYTQCPVKIVQMALTNTEVQKQTITHVQTEQVTPSNLRPPGFFIGTSLSVLAEVELFRYHYKYLKMPPILLKMLVSVSMPVCAPIRYNVIY